MPTVTSNRQRMKHPHGASVHQRLMVLHIEGTHLGKAMEQGDPHKKTNVTATLSGHPNLHLECVVIVLQDDVRLQVQIRRAASTHVGEASHAKARVTQGDVHDDPDNTPDTLTVTIENPNINPDTGTVDDPVADDIPVDLVNGDPCNP
jgi:hypothetical protein